MGFPRKISELPLRTVLKNTDLFVSVDVDTDITNKVTLESLASFIGGENQYVTGGTYNELTETIDFVGNEGFPPFSIDVSKLTEDTYVTGGTLNGAVLEIGRNNDEPIISIDLSSLSGDTNTFITGTSLNNTIYTINQNDGSSFSTDFEPLISGFTSGNTLQEVLDNGSVASLTNENVKITMTPADTNDLVFEMDSSNSYIRMNHSDGADLTWFQLKHDAVEMKNHLGSDYYYWNVPQPGTSNMKFQGVRSSVGANNYSGLEVNLTSSLLKTRQTQTGNSYSQIEVNQQDILLKYNNVLTGSDTEIEISDTGIELKLEGDTSGERKFNQYRNITSGSIFTDSVGSVGIGYANDYSLSGITQLGDRWIPDKGWVDNRISGITIEDNFVTGATLVGTTLELERNNGLSGVTVDLSPLSATTPSLQEVMDVGSDGVGINTPININTTADMPVDYLIRLLWGQPMRHDY